METGNAPTLCAALVVGGACIAGSVMAEDKVTEKTPINDTWLITKTKIVLAADDRVKGRQIEVKTKQGVVMLRGKVDSDVAKQAAADIPKLLDGLKAVKSDLEMVGPSKREVVGE